MKYKNYDVCINCIQDTTNQEIIFDKKGLCNYCTNFYKNILPQWNKNRNDKKSFKNLIQKIKNHKNKNKYDCLIGVSGGVDSSYLVYLAKVKFNLNPLLFHVDAGWNTNNATINIANLMDTLNLDLVTEVIDWETIQDLQLSFFKAQVPSLDTIQDHAFFASLYNYAANNNYKYILTGANFATESIREPLEWHYHASDLKQIIDIHKKFGKKSLKKFPQCDIFKYKLYYRYFKGIKVISPLNYIHYNKDEAMDFLEKKIGWKKYSHKHHESRFTKFYEGYWLPSKFGYDKRKVHYSSLILSKQMTRSEGINKIKKNVYDDYDLDLEFEYISKKLGITVKELLDLKNAKNKSHQDYKSNLKLIELGTKILQLIGIEKRILK